MPRKGLFYMRNIIILLLLLIPIITKSDMSECMNMQNQDKKNMCMASYSGSSTFCDKIKNFGDRTQCMRMVIAKQRTAQYGTTKEKKQGE